MMYFFVYISPLVPQIFPGTVSKKKNIQIVTPGAPDTPLGPLNPHINEFNEIVKYGASGVLKSPTGPQCL